MKYLKYFEEKSEPKVGDYVIIKPWSMTDLNTFLINNIGQINQKRDAHSFFVLYPYHDDHKVLVFFGKKYINKQQFMERVFFNNEIEFYSSDKKDCEAYLNSKKYNI